jgi:cardiolipin synthase
VGSWYALPVGLPNALTLIRVLLIPAFATAFLYGRHTLALGIFVGAGVTDALDGTLARLNNQQTRLGSFLDPMADKMLLLTSFGLLCYSREMPVWSLILVLSREVVVVGGWIIRYLMTRSIIVAPTMLGKATTMMQVVAAGVFLLNQHVKLPHDVTVWCLDAAMALTAVSGVDYLYRGLRDLERRSPAG